MADDGTTKKKKLPPMPIIAQGLVPAPPDASYGMQMAQPDNGGVIPQMPIFGQNPPPQSPQLTPGQQAGPYQTDPAGDVGNYQQPIVPQLQRGDLDAILNYQPSPALDDAVTAAQARMNEANTAKSTAGDQYQSALDAYQAAHQASPFDSYMQNALQKKIVSTLGAENSFGSRFNSGFDIGQKLAANILGPAIGLMAGKKGGQGALEASQMMKQQVAQSEQARAANSHAMNASLANLSSLYENLDPNNAKRASEMFKNRLELQKAQLEAKSKATDQLREATNGFVTAAHNASQAHESAAKAKVDTLLGLYGHDVSAASLQNNISQFQSGQPAKVDEEARKDQQLQNEATRLGISKEELALRNKEFTDKQTTEKDKGTQEGQKVQMQAMDALTKLSGHIRDRMSAVGADGTTPRYANYVSLLQDDPVLKATLSKYKQMAGFGDFSDEDALKMLGTPKSADTGGGGADIFGGIGKAVSGAVNNTGKLIFGQPTPAPVAKTPVTPAEAFAAYKRQRAMRDDH